MEFIAIAFLAVLTLAILIYFIYQRLKESDKEDFEKRDN